MKPSASLPNAPFMNYAIIENVLTAFDVIPESFMSFIFTENRVSMYKHN